MEGEDGLLWKLERGFAIFTAPSLSTGPTLPFMQDQYWSGMQAESWMVEREGPPFHFDFFF
jgi:hypothetical protein